MGTSLKSLLIPTLLILLSESVVHAQEWEPERAKKSSPTRVIGTPSDEITNFILSNAHNKDRLPVRTQMKKFIIEEISHRAIKVVLGDEQLDPLVDLAFLLKSSPWHIIWDIMFKPEELGTDDGEAWKKQRQQGLKSCQQMMPVVQSAIQADKIKLDRLISRSQSLDHRKQELNAKSKDAQDGFNTKRDGLKTEFERSIKSRERIEASIRAEQLAIENRARSIEDDPDVKQFARSLHVYQLHFSQIMESTNYTQQQKEDARRYLEHLNATGELPITPPSYFRVGEADRWRFWQGVSFTQNTLHKKVIALRREQEERVRDAKRSADLEAGRQKSLESSLKDRMSGLERDRREIQRQMGNIDEEGKNLVREEKEIGTEHRKIRGRIGFYEMFYRACVEYRAGTGINPFVLPEQANPFSGPSSATSSTNPFRVGAKPQMQSEPSPERTEVDLRQVKPVRTNPFSKP